MKMIRLLASMLLVSTFSLMSQTSWDWHDAPWFARIDDFAIGLVDGSVVIYAADSSETSLMKSTDRGNTWQHIFMAQGTFVRCVATFTSDARIVYLGVGKKSDATPNGIYKSTDGGSTWTYLSNQPTNKKVSRISIHPSYSNIVWVGCDKIGGIAPPPVVYRSTNGGTNWTPNIIDPNDFSVSDIALSQYPNRIWISTHEGSNETNGVLRTTTGGSVWQQVIDGIDPSNLQMISLAIDPIYDNILYLGEKSPGLGYKRIYKTETATEDCWWEQMYSIQMHASISDIKVDTLNRSTIYACTGIYINGLGVLKSTDYGESWSILTNGIYAKELRALAIDPISSNIVYTGGYGTCYRSDNGGLIWNEKSYRMLIASVKDIAVSSQLVMTTSEVGPIFRSTDSGTNWRVIYANENGNNAIGEAIASNPVNDNNLLVGGRNLLTESSDYANILLTTNKGDTWRKVYGCDFDEATITAISYDLKNSSLVYATVGEGTPGVGVVCHVLKSTDGGESWSSILTVPPVVMNPDIRGIVVDSTGGYPTSQILYIGGMLPNGNVWKSTNGGIDWSVKSNGLPPSVNVNSLTLDMSVNPAIVYAATVQGVYKTTNGGDVWFPINNGLTYTQVTYVYQNPKNPGFVYVVTKAENNQGHIFKTENGGESWTEINSGIPQTSLFKLSMDIKNPARLYVGTYGGGLYSSDAPPSQPQNLNIYNGVGSISMGSKFRVGFCLI